LIKKTLLLISMLFISYLSADFKEGEEIFLQKCSSCHSKYIDMNIIKKNFFENENKILKLSSPTENMLAYAIMDSPKHLGQSDDPEMQQIEIEEFLKDYLKNPDLHNSICEESIIKYYDKKTPSDYDLNSDDISNLAIYFMKYKEERLKNNSSNTNKKVLSVNIDEEKLLEKANKNKKRILVYATSKTCHFCKKMDKEVLSLNDVKDEIEKDFILLKIDIEDNSLPFNLAKNYKGITPTFFIVNSEGKLQNNYPGSWNKKDFLLILKESSK